MEAPRGVKLTGTNKPCGLTIILLLRRSEEVCGFTLRDVVDLNYRLQGIQVVSSLTRSKERRHGEAGSDR